MKVAHAFKFFGLGAATIVSIVACSGGAGTATSLRGGPDGIPGSSTDPPGTGNESPGNSGQDAPGTSNENPGSTCIDCSGSYQCTISGSGAGASDTTSYITLAPTAGGCAVVTPGDTTSDSSLICGGQFVVTDNGTTSVAGQWSGGTGRFSVSVTISGQTESVTCQLTNNVPTSTPVSSGSGSSDLDGG